MVFSWRQVPFMASFFFAFWMYFGLPPMLFHFTKWTQHCDETHWLLPQNSCLSNSCPFAGLTHMSEVELRVPVRSHMATRYRAPVMIIFYLLAIWGSIPLLFWCIWWMGWGSLQQMSAWIYLETLNCCHESPSLFEFCLLCDTACACSISTAKFHSFDVLLQMVITVLDTEQISNRRPFSLLNDEQSNKVRVVGTNQR